MVLVFIINATYSYDVIGRGVFFPNLDMSISIALIIARVDILLLECYLLTVDFRQFLGLLLQLFLLPLFLTLSHDKLVGADALVGQVEV